MKKNKISRNAAESEKKANKTAPQAKPKNDAPEVQFIGDRASNSTLDDLPPKTPSPPIPQRNPVYEPRVVHTVTHRSYDNDGKRLGHVGMVQRRTQEKLARFSGKEFAAWAVLTRDGVPDGPSGYLERFELFDLEVDAIAHAKYAAGRTPK